MDLTQQLTDRRSAYPAKLHRSANDQSSRRTRRQPLQTPLFVMKAAEYHFCATAMKSMGQLHNVKFLTEGGTCSDAPIR